MSTWPRRACSKMFSITRANEPFLPLDRISAFAKPVREVVKLFSNLEAGAVFQKRRHPALHRDDDIAASQRNRTGRFMLVHRKQRNLVVVMTVQPAGECASEVRSGV